MDFKDTIDFLFGETDPQQAMEGAEAALDELEQTQKVEGDLRDIDEKTKLQVMATFLAGVYHLNKEAASNSELLINAS